MNETPPFWYTNRSWQAYLLSPLSLIYGWIAGQRLLKTSDYGASIPVICVGNYVAGGAGKTPTTIALVVAAKKQGLKPAILTRGYGGGIVNPTQVDASHNAHDVGDEALLLSKAAPTFVSADRVLGAKAIEAVGKFNLIIMDDGFQNPRLAKDYNLLVVDARRGIGNGFTHPSGPLRALMSKQFQRTDAVLVIGEGQAGAEILRTAARRGLPTHIATLIPGLKTKLRKTRVLAFAGIGDPEKFYTTLRNMDVDVVKTRDFPDHHFISRDEAEELLEAAKEQDLQLVTTEKDMVRFSHPKGAEAELIAAAWSVPVKLKIDNVDALRPIFETAKERAHLRKLQAAS